MRIRAKQNRQAFTNIRMNLDKAATNFVKLYVPVPNAVCDVGRHQMNYDQVKNICTKFQLSKRSNGQELWFFTGTMPHSRNPQKDPLSANGFNVHEIYLVCPRATSEAIAKELQQELRDLALQLTRDSFFEPLNNVKEFELSDEDGKVLPCRCFIYAANISRLPLDAVVNAANESLMHGSGVAGTVVRSYLAVYFPLTQ